MGKVTTRNSLEWGVDVSPGVWRCFSQADSRKVGRWWVWVALPPFLSGLREPLEQAGCPELGP